jgi:uncharacterized membrane protein YphA (DoxX/SURF4 family)
MNIALWIVTALLAAVFLAAGAMKMVRPKQALADGGLAWVESFPGVAVKGIGAVEVLAAVGLVVPPLVNIAPVLSPVAAIGIILLMVGAAITHLRRHEPQLMGVNAVIVLVSAFIVWGRFGSYPY